MGQETEGHMMMPPQPAPDFIVIQPQPPFTLLEGGFDRPAHPGHPHQRRDWRVCGRVAEIDLELWVFSHVRRKTSHMSMITEKGLIRAFDDEEAGGL